MASPVHPHARGDDSPSDRRIYDVGGSPPRTWGRLEWIAQAVATGRFTPTHVGTMGLPNR